MPQYQESQSIKKPIFVSMLEFLRTGNFGPIKSGMSRSQIFLLLGFPGNYSTENPGIIFIYGNIEFHFFDSANLLGLIHTEPVFYGPPRGEPALVLDNWILQPNTTLEFVTKELTKLDIEFHQTENTEHLSRDASYITVGAGVNLVFSKELDENKRPEGLAAISYPSYKFSVQGQLSLSELNSLLFEIADAPIDLLVEKYIGDADSAEAYRQLRLKNDLVFADSKIQETVADEILFQLHQKLKNTEVEQVLWQAIISAIGRWLPEEIAEDLLDRDIAFNAFEHTPQLLNIDWKIAGKSQAKRLRLAVESYLEDKHNISRFEQFLQRFPNNQEVLEALIELEPASTKKEHILLNVINTLPNADYYHHLRQIRLWVNEARYQELTTARARDLLDTEKLAVIEAVGENNSLIAQASKDEISLDEIKALIALGQPKILRALATNKKTPPEILVELSKTKNIPLASEIRRLAQETRHQQKKQR